MVAIARYKSREGGYLSEIEGGGSESSDEVEEEVVLGNVAAARVESKKKLSRDWENASHVTKLRQQEERKLARPKIPKHVG